MENGNYTKSLQKNEIERYNKTLHYSTRLLDYAIIHNSEMIISEKGYDGVGVDLIAENAGLKGPSLYRHYKGKEGRGYND